MPLRRPLAVTLGVLALVALGGCGDARTAAPNPARIQPPGATKTVYYLHNTLSFQAPVNWTIQSGSGAMVVTLGSGPALITIWRYPRSPRQPLPADAAALQQARSAVIGSAAARNRTFRVIASAVIHLGSVPGVELDALETIRGQLRRVRSTHLYTGGAEFVVDEYAPKGLFHAVDASVFSPLLQSVRVNG